MRTNGWKWADHHHEHVRATADVPDDIADVGLDILDATLSCEQTGRGYRVQKNELGIYKTLRIPVPRVHHDIRRSTRLARRNSHKIYERTCQKCAQEVLTVYAPERHERMYCESCYRGEIC